MNKPFYVVLGDMTVGGARSIFVSTSPCWTNEAIAEFNTKQEAEDFIEEFLDDNNDFDEYDRY